MNPRSRCLRHQLHENADAFSNTFLRTFRARKKQYRDKPQHCFFWCEKRDLPACGRSGGAGKQSTGLFSYTRPLSPVHISKIKSRHWDKPNNDFFWCEKRDLNPYGVNHTPLKRARLPVPPLSHIAVSRRLLYYTLSFAVCQGLLETFFGKICEDYLHIPYCIF